MAISNLGAGFAIPGMSAVLLDAAGPRHANIAVSAMHATRQVGALAGVAVAGAVLVEATDNVAGTAVFFLIAAACFLLATALTAWRLRAGWPA
ncbi:hypothetical protein [Saccharothrix deserti]|uniref:hypothetical protein n=1 Tax=Saccharothrix deserti TaxID=2593674 RepID=UPI001EE481A6|nr:hypothetical protein [Saccharothrix deserti]